MSSRLLFLFALSALGAGLGLTGCGEDDTSKSVGGTTWTTDPEIISYCKDFCGSLECTAAGKDGSCRDQCEYWIAGLGEKCGDELKATYACQATLTCEEFNTFNANPRESEKCGVEFADHVDACAEESPGCEAYCALAGDCDPDFGMFCLDNCTMRQAWFKGYYGDKCVAAAEKLYACEGGLTCDDLDAEATTGEVPADCQDEHDDFDEACTL